MPINHSYDYAIIRLVPRVERGEFMNVGVILFCRTRRFLGARIQLHSERVQAFAPMLEIEEVRQHLELIPQICQGGKKAGPIGELQLAERFHWLVAPRSTIIQLSPVHSGLCTEPAKALEQLFQKIVAINNK